MGRCGNDFRIGGIYEVLPAASPIITQLVTRDDSGRAEPCRDLVVKATMLFK